MAKQTKNSTSDFTLNVDGISGLCPPGEAWATKAIEEKWIPVLSCEGPCVRGDIARLAANMVTDEGHYARCCFQESLLVPYSTMARWLKSADKIVMIDGCFLTCTGRLLKNIVDEEKIIHIDALSLYKKYNDIFSMEDVPLEERTAVAREVADQILGRLNEEG